jgi:hypothetical protein
MYSLIKPLLDPNTRKKVHILGSNYRDTLLEVHTATRRCRPTPLYEWLSSG